MTVTDLEKSLPGMEYVRLGKTGLRVSYTLTI